MLDVGSGTGFYLKEWTKLGVRQLNGSDITETATLHLARLYPNATIVQADVGDEEFRPPDYPVDVVSAFDVLFHIVDDARYARALRNIAGALSPGGWFLYSDNLVDRPTGTVHYKSRNAQDIMHSLDAAGFTVRKRVPVFVLMNDPVSSKNRALRRWFSFVFNLSRRSENAGDIVGRLLFPLELLAGRIVRHGPSTEIIVCQRH